MTAGDRARKRGAALANKPTKPMQDYLEILLNDVGYGTRVQRNAFLSSEVDRDIHYLDELTYDEAHRLIGDLKGRKNG